MNISRIDLNLLVYFDVLLREKNVTRAANHLGITQPAMSNVLKRLRDLFSDPLLIRTSEGMTPTAKAMELEPMVRTLLTQIEYVVQPTEAFNPAKSRRLFRIMASDYAESTLIPRVLSRLRKEAPGVILDMLTPSDVSFLDVEQGRVDMAINRFDKIPQSFHQKTIWEDAFSCLLSVHNPLIFDFTLENYLNAQHIWVSKTGFGIGVGVDPKDIQRLGWVDEALARINKKRRITVFTRHYHVAMQLAQEQDLIATLPSKAAKLTLENPKIVVKPPPFKIPPIELKMAWSPLLQNNQDHRWLRNLIAEVADRPVPEEVRATD